MKTIVTKAQFAEMRGVTPSAVSNYIKQGKISEAALQGTGNRAKIWAEQALSDLARTLDQSQQVSRPALSPMLPASVAPSSTSDDEDLRRRRAADAIKAEQEAIAATRRNETESGRWIDAQEVRKEYGQELAKLIGSTDTFVGSTLARALADRFGLEWKDVSLFCRTEYRKFRAAGSEQTKADLAAHEAALAAEQHDIDPVVNDVSGQSAIVGVADVHDGTGATTAG